MSFCPKWIFEAACAAAASEYLSRQLDLNTVASGYAATLSKFTSPSTLEVAGVIEKMLRFWMSSTRGKQRHRWQRDFAITKLCSISPTNRAS